MAQTTQTHTITIVDNFFSPNYLEINVGDTVIFEWDENAQGHNVVQTKASNSIRALEDGFSSGELQSYPFTYTIPEEYTSTNTTLYFMCEPHASSGMIGEIVVGTGSSDENDASFNSMYFLFTFIVVLPVLKAIQKRSGINCRSEFFA